VSVLNPSNHSSNPNQSPAPGSPLMDQSPFLLQNEQGYQQWRQWKLAQRPRHIEELLLTIHDPWSLRDEELTGIRNNIRRANMTLYQLDSPQSMNKPALKALCAQLGMHRLDSNLCSDDDGISSITPRQQRQIGEYIPYTHSPISWHCDGYYNENDKQIRGMVLHCVTQAQSGGRNGFIDPELVYMALRDDSPQHIAALMQDDAMTIPANILDGVEIRPAVTGPVFSVDHRGNLHMRYTARTRSIAWKADAAVQAAQACLRDYLKSAQADQYFYQLQAGQGIISNNVLHCRDGFDDTVGEARLLYRARYYDGVATGADSVAAGANAGVPGV